MELLRQHCTLQEAEDIATLLRSRGIVTFISNRQTNVTGSFTTGANTVSLWVVLRDQLQDAIGLLNNQEHKVTTGLAEDELIALEEKVANFKTSSLSGLYHVIAGVVLIAVTLGGVIFAIHHLLS